MTLGAASLSSGAAARPGRPRAARWGFVTLGYTLLVILFGAVVRITGSGAGCGQHWPTCHGEVAHLPSSLETAIELTHRVTSGLTLPLLGAVAFLCFRVSARGEPVRRHAVASVLLLLVEAGIGAVLVRLELVGQDDSPARAAVMSLHLVNTSLLTAALVLMAHTVQNPSSTLRWSPRFVLAAVGVLLVSMSGAVTALGDTVYPLGSAAAAGAPGHFLMQVRALHPVLAVLVSVYLTALSAGELGSRSPAARFWARALLGTVLAQIFIGVVNVLLSAPAFMQVLHLGAANALWLALILFWARRTAMPSV